MIINLNRLVSVRITILAAGLICVQACAQVQTTKDTQSSTQKPRLDAMNDLPLPPNHDNAAPTISAKRLAPPEITPIFFEDIQYMVSTAKSEDDLKSITTLNATKADGQLVWQKEVYTIEFNAELEMDVQEVYVSRMALNENKDAIVIENEQGESFTLAIK